ncbi:ABC transporter substrate-binding protein [Pseudomonas sp. Pseusp122]|uniref:ABC transporter substrate-binding protein n=1 Tax=unclassified Pseudomonas TaxID=196821 RepID=UPI0039A43E86
MSQVPATSRMLYELAPSGTLRVAINLGNPVLAQPGPVGGDPVGVSVELARALAKQLGLPLRLITFDAAGKVFAALSQDQWDLAFLAIEPERAEQLAFSRPYVTIEGTYLVRRESPDQQTRDLDQPGRRIAVGHGAAYDLYLSRTLAHADLIRGPTSAAAVDLFLERALDAAAGVRQPLEQIAKAHPQVRVLPDSFTEIQQAMAVPRERELAAAYVDSFIEEQLRNGFVARALEFSGQRDVQVPGD